MVDVYMSQRNVQLLELVGIKRPSPDRGGYNY